MTSRIAPAAALAALALLSGCERKAPPPVTDAPAPAPEPTPWSFYELGSLIVIEGEVAEGTSLYLKGATLLDHREAEAGPVRWELYKPAQREDVELQDALGHVLARWTFEGLRAPGEPLPRVGHTPPNGQPSDDAVAALASRITWSSPQETPVYRAPAPRPEPPPRVRPVDPPRVTATAPRTLPGVPDPRAPRELPEAPPRVQAVPAPRLALGRPAGTPPPVGDPRPPRELPEATPKVRAVPPPRVGAFAPGRPAPSLSDPRQLQPLPEATPKVQPSVPQRPSPSRTPIPPGLQEPRPLRELPEATPRVQPVLPPRVQPPRPMGSVPPNADPRSLRTLPEATPEVHPGVPERTPLPSARTPLSGRLEPLPPRTLPDAVPPPLRSGAPWPGAGEALNLVRGPRTGRRILLTFDGGSSAEVAGEVLDLLRDRGIRTTFFLTGAFIDRFPDLVRRMAREGHELGNHTQNHPHFAPNMRRDPAWTRERIQEELLSADRALYRLLGRPMDPYWRAPYGEQTAEIRRWAEELGYRHIGWSEGADTLDWATPAQRKLYRTGDAILKRLHTKLEKDGEGLIVLMHLGSEREEEDRPSKGLGPWIDRALREGWTFVSVGQSLRQLGKPAWDAQERVAMLGRP